jgi:hypothetical protein
MFKSAAAMALLITAFALSAVVWLGFSAPTVHHLALPPDLIDASSAKGQQLLVSASARTDYDELKPYFVAQSRRAFCGIATSVMVINAALHPQPAITQQAIFTPASSAVRSNFAVTFRGLTLEQLAQMLKTHGMKVQVVHAAQTNLESFRQVARTTLAEPHTFLILNYSRSALSQEGGGHISPAGAYSAETDRILVLDVAAQKYPYTWLPVTELWSAMNSLDSNSHETRGYLLVTASTSD